MEYDAPISSSSVIMLLTFACEACLNLVPLNWTRGTSMVKRCCVLKFIKSDSLRLMQSFFASFNLEIVLEKSLPGIRTMVSSPRMESISLDGLQMSLIKNND